MVCSNSPFKTRFSILLSCRKRSRPTCAEYFFIYFNIIIPYNTGISAGVRHTVPFTSHPTHTCYSLCPDQCMFFTNYHNVFGQECRSQWPRGLRRRSATARLLGLWIRIPPGAWRFVCCKCYVLSDRDPCDELITRPEDSY